MAQTLLLKRSAVPGKVPTTSDIPLGSLALNTYDGKLFTKTNQSGTEAVVDLSAGGSGVLNELDGGSASSVFTPGSLTAIDGGAA